MAPVLDRDETKVYADMAYTSKNNRKLLKDHAIKDGLLHKKRKRKELTKPLKILNKINARIRAGIERTFAHLKTILGYRKARNKGWDKNQIHLDLLATAYKLKRSLRVAIG